MGKRSETIVAKVTLTWDPDREDKKAALASVFLNMGEGLANGHKAGKLPNRGSWQLGEGEELLR